MSERIIRKRADELETGDIFIRDERRWIVEAVNFLDQDFVVVDCAAWPNVTQGMRKHYVLGCNQDVFLPPQDPFFRITVDAGERALAERRVRFGHLVGMIAKLRREYAGGQAVNAALKAGFGSKIYSQEQRAMKAAIELCNLTTAQYNALLEWRTTPKFAYFSGLLYLEPAVQE